MHFRTYCLVFVSFGCCRSFAATRPAAARSSGAAASTKSVRTNRISQPKTKLAASGQGWVEDFSPGAVKGIGTAEVLGALGLVLPALLNIATVLALAAAAGLFVLMAGAALTHARRREVLTSSSTLRWGCLRQGLRFGPYSF